ncbi:hypothetical protein DI14_12565, partial [Exiguobacterium sp. AB2]
RLTASGQYLYRLRPQTVERSFADAKELHGLRFTFYRGREAVQRANLVAATAQNMKKLANLFAWRDRIHTIFSILCRAERLKLIEPKKRRTNPREANWFVNSLKRLGYPEAFRSFAIFLIPVLPPLPIIVRMEVFRRLAV